jgi:YVTN family beta-propeller protein/VCBS repeat-containing protein
MGYARYVGRVGALAVALGVGAVVAGGQGTAWADTTDSSVSGADTTSEPGGETADVGAAAGVTSDTAASSTDTATTNAPPEVVISVSGGAQLITPGQESTERTGSADATPPPDTPAPPSHAAAPAADTAVVTESGNSGLASDGAPQQALSTSVSARGGSQNSTSTPIRQGPATPSVSRGAATAATDEHRRITDTEQVSAVDIAIQPVVSQQDVLRSVDTAPTQPASTPLAVVLGTLGLMPLPNTDTPSAPPAAPLSAALALAVIRREQREAELTQTSSANANVTDTSISEGSVTIADSTQAVALADKVTTDAVTTLAAAKVSQQAKPTKPPKPPNPRQAPTAVNDSYATDEDTALSIQGPGLLTNDSDPQGSALTAVLVSQPAHGTVTVNANGSFTYTPAADYSGQDSFTYKASDGTFDSAPATVSVTVTAVNDAPVAKTDTATVAEGGTTTINVVANDTDQDGTISPSTVVINQQPSSGTVTVNANGTVTYISNGAEVTTDSFSYTVKDNAGLTSNVATVTITVNPVNDAPVAVNDAYNTAEDTAVVVSAGAGVLANDSDAEAGALTATLLSGPGHAAQFTLNSDGSFTYTPAANFSGTDTFTYTVTDNSLAPNNSATGTATITVTAVNDAPVAASDTYRTAEGAALVVPAASGVLANDSDAEADSLTATLLSGPGHAAQFTLNSDGSFTYTPAANFSGTDTFTYRVTDNSLAPNNSATGTVTITVAAAEVPNTVVATIPAGQGSPQWIAFNASGTRGYVTNQGNGTVSVIDTATNTIVGTITVGAQPTTAALGPNGNIYVSNQGSGTVSVIDPTNNTVVATINVGGHPLGFAFDDTKGLGYVTGGSGNFVKIFDLATNTVVGSIPVSGNPAQAALTPDGTRLYVTNQFAQSLSVIDTATNQVVATIPMGLYPTIVEFNSTGTRAYVTNEFSNKVYVVNTATNTVLTTINVGTTPIDINLSADDSRAYVTNFSGLGPTDLRPGSVSVIDLATNTVIATIPVGTGPVGSAITPDGSHLYVVNSAGTISVIALEPTNDAPLAGGDTATVAEGGTTTIVVLGNDTDADGTVDSTSVRIVQQPANGSASVNPDGTITYISNGAEVTSDTFSYNVADNSGAVSNAAVVTVTVTAVNDAPVAFNDDYRTLEDTALAVSAGSGVLANDTDAESGTMTATLLTGPSHAAQFTLNADGSFTYTPTANFSGSDTFTYTVTDNSLAPNNSATGTVTITVDAVVDAPPIPDSDNPFTPGDPQPGDPAATVRGTINATDPQGLDITYSYDGATTLPDGSILTVNPDGTFVYQPSALARHLAAADDAAQTGADTFTFDVTATNTAGASVTFSVSLPIEPANQEPIAPASAPTVAIDPRDGTVAGSIGWSDPDGDTLVYRNPDGSTSTSWTTAGGGTVTVHPDGSFTYTPDPYDRLNAYIHPDQNTDTFDVVVTDGHGSTQTITVTVTVDPTAAAVTNSVSSPPADTFSGYAAGPDGTVALTTLTGTGSADDPYQTTVIVLRPDAPSPITDTIAGAPRGVRVGADGTVASTTVTGSGSADDPYQTTVTVLREGDATPTTATVAGSSFGEAMVGADGTVALTTFTGSGSADDPYQTTVTVLRDGDATPTTATVTGFPSGPALVGADGTVALTTYTGSDTADDPYQTTVTVLRPGATTPETVSVTGRPSGSAQVGADGTVVLTTITGSGSSEDPYETTVTVLRPGQTTAVTFTIAGLQNGPTVGDDGTVVLDAFIGSGGADDPYRTAVTVLRPGATTPTTTTVAGFPVFGVQVGADGTVAFATYTGSGSADDPYETTVTVLRPGETTPTTAIVAGLPNGGVQVGADGTVAMATVTGSGSADDPYESTVTVLRPGETTPTTATVTGSRNSTAQVGADGTVAMTTITGSGSADDPYAVEVTVLRPGAASVDTATVTGVPIRDAQVGADGTVTLTTVTGSGSADDPYETTVTVIRPSETTSTTFPGHPTGGALVGADGTVNLTTYTGSGSAADPFVVTASTITLADVNDAPVARNDSYSAVEDTALDTVVGMLAGVLANDTDADSGDTLSVLAETKGTLHGGTVAINSDGSFTYTPAANFSGQDSFTYTVADDAGAVGNTATVTVTVNSVNDAPLAADDSAGALEGGSTTIAVLSNDTDVDGAIDSSSVVIVSQPSYGSVSVNADGTITYRSNGAEVSSDSFSYTVADGAGAVGSAATVTVTITQVNDAPVAVDDSATVVEGGSTSIAVLGNDTDVDGTIDSSSVVIVSQPSYGSVSVNADGSITYVSNGAEMSSDSFTYTVADNAGAVGSAATVTVTITPVNDAPVSVDDAAGVLEGGSTTIAVLGNDTDVDGTIDSSSVVIVSQPSYGSVSVNPDGTITYRSNGAEISSDSFSYTVADTVGAVGNTATVTVTITPVNDAPAAVDDSASVVEGGSTTIAVLGNDTDVDGTIDSSSVVIVSQPAYGSASVNPDGTITYRSNGAEVSSDSFTYTVADTAGAVGNTATVTVTVTAVNDAPVSVDDAAGVLEGGSTTIAVLGNDTDVDGTIDSSSVVIVSQPAYGSVSVNPDGTITYRSNGAEISSDSFTYTVADNAGAVGNTATVTVTITPVNDAPAAVNDAYQTNEDIALNSTSAGEPSLLANDIDPDTGTNAGLTVTAQTKATAQGGSVTVYADGSFVYTPKPNFNGTDSFTYTVRDAANASTVGTATVSVAAVNDAPVANTDSYSATEDTPLNSATAGLSNLLANDTDPDIGTNVGLSAVAETNKATAQGGTVTINSDGSFVYTPKANFNGQDSFTYRVSDGALTSNTATVTITVAAVNDAPASTGAPTVNPPDSAGVVKGTLNVVDPDNDVLSYTITQPQNGTVTISSTGAFTYTADSVARLAAYNTPNADYDSFSVVVSDGHGETKTVDVTVEIAPSHAAFTGTIDLGGDEAGHVVQAPNGKFYQVVSGGTSADTRIIEIDPEDPMNPRTIIAGPGTAYGNVQIGSDGKLYQTSYTSTTTYLAIIDPTSSAPPTIVTIGAGTPSRNLYKASDGYYYIHTYTGTSSSGYASQVVRVDLANPQNIKTFNAGPGIISSYSVKSTSDGKLFVTTNSGFSSTGTVRVAQIDPNDPTNPKIFVAGTGWANGDVQLAPNGIMYQQISTPGGYAVALLSPVNPNSPTVVTLPGTSYTSGLSSNGFGAFASYVYTPGSGNTPVYTHYVTIVNPQDPSHPTTVNIGQTNGNFSGSLDVGPDGTAYYTRSEYNSSIGYYDNYRITTVRRDGTFSTVQLPSSTSGYGTYRYPAVFGTDGTRYQVSQIYTGSTVAYYVTVIDPDAATNAKSILLPNAPVGNIITGKLGVTYLALPSTGTPGNYTTPVMMFTPDNPYEPTTYNLQGKQIGWLGLLPTSGGQAVIVTDSGTGTLYMHYLAPDDPPYKLMSAPAGTPVGEFVRGPDDKYYLTYTKTVSGSLSTFVLALNPDNFYGSVHIAAGPGAAVGQVQVGPDGKLYQTTATSGAGASTYVTIIDPSAPNNPTVVNAGPGRAVSTTLNFVNGVAYLTTATGGTSTTDTTRLVRIDPSNPNNPTVLVLGAGYPTGSPVFRPDGTIFQQFYNTSLVGGQTRYTNYVAVVDPSDFTHPTIVTLPGQATTASLQFGPDGTAFATSRSGNGTASTNYVTVIDPDDPAHPKNVTLPGQLIGVTVTYGLNGTAYVLSQSASGSTYTNYITVVDPDGPVLSANVTLPGTDQIATPQVGPDGDLYILTRTPTATANVFTYHLSTIDPETRVLRTINLGDLRSAGFPYNTSYSDYHSYFDGSGYYEQFNQAFAAVIALVESPQVCSPGLSG